MNPLGPENVCYTIFMSLMFTFTAYCSECGRDLDETDADESSFDETIQLFESRTSRNWEIHLKEGKCIL